MNFLEGLIAYWLNYKFLVYSPNEDNWNEVGGLYVFANLVGYAQDDYQWRPLWIGKTGNFANRIPSHGMWGEAESCGATHIHAMPEPSETRRAEIEVELIRYYQPILNDLLK